jgi:shikimate dehydrogenase
MKHFFVIGNRTSKSLSPLIFNHWFKIYNIDAKYSFVEVEKNNFEKILLKKINSKKTHGFNVTIPFKADVFKYINIKNNHSKNIGAINCVKIDKINRGINTDWVGYLNSIKECKINKSKKIIILGYGGASKAIIYGLYYKGFKNVIVFNRSKKLIRLKKKNFFTKEYKTIDRHLGDADLIINTTPINPLTKKQIKKVEKNTIISDIVYRPKNTSFLKNFRENTKIYGISMLIEQAIPCFYMWFGFKPKVDYSLIKKLEMKTK